MPLFFMRKVIEVISQGKFFKVVCSAALSVSAYLTALLGLIAWCGLWLTLEHLQGFAVLALIVHQGVYVVVIYMQVHTALIRAADIRELPEGNFTVIPIISVFFKLFGEQTMILCVYFGLISGLLSSAMMGRGLPFIANMLGMGYGTTGLIAFFYGILMLVVFVIIGFMMLVFFYLLSESTLLFADIAINIKSVRRTLEGNLQSLPGCLATDAAALAEFSETSQKASSAAPEMKETVCPHCGNEISANAKFCRSCGNTIGD